MVAKGSSGSKRYSGVREHILIMQHEPQRRKGAKCGVREKKICGTSSNNNNFVIITQVDDQLVAVG